MEIIKDIKHVVKTINETLNNESFIVNISEEDRKSFLKDIKKIIEDCDKAYYEKSELLITDSEYDKLLLSYEKLNKKKNTQDSLSLGESKWNRKHYAPMLSLQKAKSFEEVESIVSSVAGQLWIYKNKLEWFIEPKFDGLSVELVYIDWELKDAVTRWDGEYGESIFHTVQHIPWIPHQIDKLLVKKYFVVRWEIVLPLSNFDRVENKKEWTNARNLASGIVRNKVANVNNCKQLRCYVYDWIYQGINLEDEKKWFLNFTQEELNELFKLLKFTVYPFNKLLTLPDIQEFLNKEETAEFLENNEIEMDWYVCKLNNIAARERLGYTWHHPKWAFAFKYQAEITTTEVLDIVWQTWKTGILTPVANLKPVQLNGVTIRRATLHNYDIIRSKGIYPWSSVFLQRSWEVIPYIVGVDDSIENTRMKGLSEEDKNNFQKPHHCETCGSWVKMVLENNLHKFYCENENCPARLAGKVLQVVGKKGFDLEGFWEEFVDLIVNKGFITLPCEVLEFEKYKDELYKIEWFWERKIQNLQSKINRFVLKPYTLKEIVVALNIPNVTRNVAQIFIDELIKTKKEITTIDEFIEWLSIPSNYQHCNWIWNTTVEAIQNTLKREWFQKEIDILKKIVKNIDFPRFEESKGEQFHFSITGSFPFSRPEIVKKLESIGGVFHSSPTKECNVVFIGSDAWSKKDKAVKLWLHIIDNWDEMIEKFPVLVEA